MAAGSTLAPALEDLLARGDLWRGDALAGTADPDGVVPSGHPALDAELPGGGWPRAALTELLLEQPGVGELSLLLPALASLAGEGVLALVDPPWRPYAPAWQAAGIDPDRLWIVRAGTQSAWSLEQLILSDGFAAVLAWPDAGLGHAGLRRLQLAAEGRRVFACLCRPAACAAHSSPAALRLAVAGGRQGVRLRILKRRGGAALRPLDICLPRPGNAQRALAGSLLSPSAAGSPVALALA